MKYRVGQELQRVRVITQFAVNEDGKSFLKFDIKKAYYSKFYHSSKEDDLTIVEVNYKT